MVLNIGGKIIPAGSDEQMRSGLLHICKSDDSPYRILPFSLCKLSVFITILVNRLLVEVDCFKLVAETM